MFTVAYFKSLGERAITVFAASLGGLLSAGAFNLLDAPWGQSLATAGMATLVAVLLSIAGGKATSSEAPAFTSEKTEKEIALAPENKTPYL